MRKPKYTPRISDILGVSLILAMILYFLMSWLSGFFGMETGSLLVKIFLSLPIFLIPAFVVFAAYKRYALSIPRPKCSLNYNESAMLTVSAFGAIVLIQILYASIFPSTVKTVGIAETDSIAGFVLLFFGSVVVSAVVQEVFFHGVVLRALTAYRALLAILISSVAYALMQFSLEEFPLAFFCGFLIGSVYIATGSLGSTIGLHIAVNAMWFLSETVRVYLPEQHALFTRVLVAACVLLFAFGLPFLKKTVRAILADEQDETALTSYQFWSVPIAIFFIVAISVQLIFGTV